MRMPIEENFDPIAENGRMRLGKVDRSDGRVTIEVMVLLIPPFSTLRHLGLERSAELVERLESLDISMQYLEGGWAVGELTVDAALSEASVCKIRSSLRSFGYDR